MFPEFDNNKQKFTQEEVAEYFKDLLEVVKVASAFSAKYTEPKKYFPLLSTYDDSNWTTSIHGVISALSIVVISGTALLSEGSARMLFGSHQDTKKEI